MNLRSSIYALTLGSLVLASFATEALAQTYPTRGPIRMVVGFAAGGGTDTLARRIAQSMGEKLGQTVVVETKIGAAGSIASQDVAQSKPDGYTLNFIPDSATVLPSLQSGLSYDLEKDFTPVSVVGVAPLLMVASSKLNVKNIQELIALARSQPGKLNYGSNGIGTATHLSGVLFTSMANLNIVHVPYNGEVSVATAGGEIDMSFTSISSASAMMSAGKLIPMAVTTPRRSAALPDVPTMKEAGLPEYDHTTWYGVLAPAGLPKDILAKLNGAIVQALQTPDMKDAMTKLGVEPQSNTPEEFAKLIHNDIALNAKLLKLAGVPKQ